MPALETARIGLEYWKSEMNAGDSWLDLHEIQVNQIRSQFVDGFNKRTLQGYSTLYFDVLR